MSLELHLEALIKKAVRDGIEEALERVLPTASRPSADPDELMTTDEVARVTKRSKAAVIKDRLSGGGIPFVRLGGRSIRYRRREVDAYLASRTFNNTKEKP